MAFIAGGELRAGASVHRLTDYCMDTTEVTAAAYALCVERAQCGDDGVECDDAWTYRRPQLREHPMNCVSWAQADRCCRASGKRLPTWEEWEWAAQGRNDRRRYVWGDTAPGPDQMCWSLGVSRSGTCPVGSYPASRSPQNVDDLFGNVWEWLAPQHRSGVPNVSRGASWQNADLSMLEGDNAGSFVPGFVRNDVVGFRCVYDGDRPPTRSGGGS
jgi:sulfatase modifying factor 1